MCGVHTVLLNVALNVAARLEKLISIKQKNIKFNYYYERDLLNGDTDHCCRCLHGV